MAKRKKVKLDASGLDYKYFMVKIRGMFTNKEKAQLRYELEMRKP